MSDADTAGRDAEIGAALKECRLSLHIKQEELAQALGVTRATITRYELGLRRLTVAALIEIADALGLQASDLLPARHQRHPPVQPAGAQQATTSIASTTEQAPIQAIVRILEQRPDLLPTVIDLLETMLTSDVAPGTAAEQSPRQHATVDQSPERTPYGYLQTGGS